MAKVENIPECGVNLSDTSSAFDTCKINVITLKKPRKTSQPNLSSERIKLVSTDLLGYYTAKYTDHHSGVKASSYIEKPPSNLPTSDLATSQVKARQLALQRKGCLKQRFETDSQYIRVVGTDKMNRPLSISVRNRYAKPLASPQGEEFKPSPTSVRRSTTSARRTSIKLKHRKLATTALARKTAFDNRD